MVSLHEINEWNVQHFLFDGVVTFEGRKRHLQAVPFRLLSIGCYEEVGCSSIGSNVWIQSFEGLKFNIWYRLGRPSPEYRRYHTTFLWMADLAKHVVDFLYTHDNVCLSHFRSGFYEWLSSSYSGDDFATWIGQYDDVDFRRAVVSQADFLFCQAVQVDRSYKNHPLWAEILPRDLCAVPEQVEKRIDPRQMVLWQHAGKTEMTRMTTVTSYVFQCFRYLPWAKFLCAQESSSYLKFDSRVVPTQDLIEEKPSKPQRQKMIDKSGHPCLDSFGLNVCVGDVVAVPRDSRTIWKSQGAEWYAYVQSVEETPKGAELGLLWLYRPSDTACMKMLYPHEREIFLSNHCNCRDPPLYADEVIRKPSVAFFGQSESSGGEFFCRQQYVEADGAWVTLKESHFQCPCRTPKENLSLKINETVLVSRFTRDLGKTLEPVVVFNLEPDSSAKKVEIRTLLRRQRDFGVKNAAPNELVYTDELQIIPVHRINRRCHIRFYTEQERDRHEIPCPYDRHGTADCYFITSQLSQTPKKRLEPLHRPWPSDLIEGWDPLQSPPQSPLRGLELFCGGGNFSRGLAEGLAVKFHWLIDYSKEAIHTTRVNLERPGLTRLFYGSVNHFLSEAIKANDHGGLVAQAGEVDFIAAGSPCPGFSLANPNRGDDRGLLNESLVASAIAYIDFYRPKYALLENVRGMACGGEDKNVLAAVTCALVGLGYQTRTFALDAWSYGAAQSRSRIFISATAPGLTPLPEPPQTHGHPDDVKGGGLGRTANGLQTSTRFRVNVPFDHVTAQEVTSDLPSTDARIHCIRYPDHRMSRNISTLHRVQISCIPRSPAGCGFIDACARNFMPQAQIDHFVWRNQIRAGRCSRAWSRVKATRLMPTIMTIPKPDDGVSGTCLHWQDHRLLTILEARRAQGYPDNEVIVGSLADQWKIVGNSVARPVALALGMSLREAWLANESIKDHSDCMKHFMHGVHTRTMDLPAEELPIAANDTDSWGRVMSDLPIVGKSAPVIIKALNLYKDSVRRSPQDRRCNVAELPGA